MGDWAKAAFQKLKEREGPAHQENQRLALEREQILDTAPVIWEQVAGKMLEETPDFEKMRPGYLKGHDETANDNPIVTVWTKTRKLHVIFNRDIPSITYEISEGSGAEAMQIVRKDFTFRVSFEEVWIYDDANFPVTIDEVVTRSLDHLV
jgi:hypothetical protein